jgi:hypothetical protein
MKKLLAPLVLSTVLATSAAGCYGSYSAFNSVHRWNGHATDNRIANSVIHFGLWVVPVYPIVLFADWLVFNNVEFISGKPVFN